MHVFNESRLNPNPITKLFVVGLLGFTVVHRINPYFEWGIMIFLSFMFYINGFKRDSFNNIFGFFLLFLAPNFTVLEKLPLVLKFILSFFFVIRMFYLPFSAGKFFIKSSDVGSIISSMDKLGLPNSFSIPIAVMFRYFPSFKEERKHIKMAMRIRGIRTLNPILYLEYVLVPLLIISSNISEDISKAAESKCIENPIKKTRYVEVSIKAIDFLYGVVACFFVIGGWLCLK